MLSQKWIVNYVIVIGIQPITLGGPGPAYMLMVIAVMWLFTMIYPVTCSA